MNGRLEGELKKKAKVDKMLENMPEYVKKWVTTMRASNKTESTVFDYVNKVRTFLSYIDKDVINLLPESITADITCEYFNTLKTVEKNGTIVETSDSYKITNWYCLSSFLGFMERRGYISYNYMNDISKSQNKDLQRINMNRKELTDKDLVKLLRAVDNGAGTHRARAKQKHWKERDKAILALFIITGMRETALSQINIEDIDFDDNTLIVRDKRDKKFQYLLKDNIKKYIVDWLNKREELANEDMNTDALFISNRRERLNAPGLQDIVYKYSQQALGFRISPHKLRAAFGTILYAKNPDIYFVSKAMGHANIETTKRYIITKNAEIDKAATIMDNII